MVHSIVIGLIFLTHFLVLTISREQIQSKAEYEINSEILDLKEHSQGITSLLVLEEDFTSSIESGNYAEVLRVIENYKKGRIADKFIIYNTNGEIFAESGAPGYFGRKDVLSPFAIKILKEKKIDNILIQRKDHIELFSFHSISTVNGLIGSLFVGKNINNLITDLNLKQDYYLKNIKIIKSSDFVSRWNYFYINTLSDFELPIGTYLRFEVADWAFVIIKIFVSFLALCFIYFIFIKVWNQYQEANLKLRQEEISRASSARLVALGEMSAGLAHEINNPLTIIILKLNQILKKINENNLDTEKLKDDILLLLNTSNRISKIVKGIKGVSRNAENDPMEKVNLKVVVDDAFALCRERFKNNNVELSSNLSELNDIYILGKSTQMTQVILNLLGNGLDAVSGLDERWVKLMVEILEQNVFIRIIDSGQGIPDHVLEKMKTAFFTTKEVGRGTGLGLHITRNIINDHHGEFYYDPASKNTCFVIRLPIYLS